jgi:methionine--tRNA ligase beta chain
LDDGTPEGRQVCAGIRQWYDPAALVGRQVIIVANLEPRKIRGEISQGMILAASDLKEGGAGAAGGAAGSDTPDGRDVIVLTLDRPAKPGSTVS